jgi:hypothetical protein
MGNVMLICKALWTLLRGSFNAYVRSSLCVSSDLPGVNPVTLNGMILYYRLMTKWSGLGDSTELSLLTVKFRQPSHEFTFGVGMTFVSYPLVLTPVV